MRSKRKKSNRLNLSVIVVLALIVQMLTPFSLMKAADPAKDVTDQVAADFIQGVDIKEKTGVIIGDTLIGKLDIDKTTQFWLQYDFEVPNGHTIVAGDFMIFAIPDEITIPNGGQPYPFRLPDLIIDGEGAIAEAYLDAGNKIRIVFTDVVEELSNVGGAFYLAGNFDENNINTDGTDTEIKFDIPTDEKLIISIKKDPIAEPDPVTVQKDGAITSGTSIGWVITVNKENVKVDNAVVVDAIPSSQTLVESSIQVNGAAPTEGVSVTDNTLSIALGDITTQQVITFNTLLTEEALLAALEAGDTTIPVINDATLQHDDNKTTNADSPKTVQIPLNILSKSGVKNAATTATNTKDITWTIVVNEDELDFDAAIINDTLPAGLTYKIGTAKNNGVAITPSVAGSVLTFTLGNITEKVTITYDTEIDPTYFQENAYGNSKYNFTNTAVLTWAGLTGAGVAKNGSVGVESKLFIKSGTGYNEANSVISWNIAINNENISLVNPVITDVIPADQQYIEGSAKIVDHQGNTYAGGSFNYTAVNKTLSYAFNADINSKYTITFDTKPTSMNDITANGSGKFLNTANFKSGSIDFNDTGERGYTSKVFEKQADGYDLNTRIITWKFIVNENGKTTASSNPSANNPSLYNAIPLENVSIVDAIPPGLEFIPGSVKVFDSNDNPVNGLVTATGTATVTFAFALPITDQYTITFDTKITDDSKFTSKDNVLNNGNFNVGNEATLNHNKTDKANKDSANQEIKNHIVSKQGIATTYGNKYIDWVVYLNSNAVNLNQLLDIDKFWLIDHLQEGLELDTTSVALIAYDKAIVVPDSNPANENDGLGAGRNITLDGTHIKYDATTREFRLNLDLNAPDDKIKTAYKLSFRTFVTETVASGTSFTNDINLFGSKLGVPVNIDNAYQSGSARSVSFLEAGSIGYGNLGKFVVSKVDLEDTNNKLSGAIFALYDRFGNKVQEKATVDGELEFNRIKFDYPYYIKEIEAPTGYLLTSGNVTVDGNSQQLTTTGAIVEKAIEVTLESAGSQKSLALTFANQKIRAKVQFTKQFEQPAIAFGTPSVATFELRPTGSTPADQSKTASNLANGTVLFENVKYGTYDLYETEAPSGYLNKVDVNKELVKIDTITVTTDGATVELNSTDYPTNTVTNNLIKSSITFNKLDGSGAGLAGAEFTLYKLSGSPVVSEVEVAKVTSKADGTVEFTDVLAGTYKIRETKAPFGYEPITGDIGMDSITVTESDHNQSIPGSDVTNVLIQAGIEFEKIESRNNDPLQGAIFGLYSGTGAELIPPVRSTSGVDGKVTFTDVGEGSYIIKEVNPPVGYELNTTEYKVSVTDTDHTQTVSITVDGQATPVTQIVNKLIEADVTFTKLSDKSGMDGIGLQGAKFHLKPIDAKPLYPILYPTEVYEAESDVNGIVLFENVPYGEYELYEDSVPTGYNLMSGVIGTVNINAANQGLIHPLDIEGNKITKLTNKIIKGHIEFLKVDKNGKKPLKNAHFGLYEKTDTKFDNEIATAISDENGLVRFTDVEYGEYSIVEIVAPSGYYRAKEIQDVFIDTQDKVYSLNDFENVKMPNELVEGMIEINKLNEPGNKLAGAKFALYDVMGKKVAEAVTNSSGIARFSPLEEGVYTVEEVEAPKNYVKSDQIETVAMSLEQNYVKLTFVNERSADAPWPGVSVQKTDDAGNILAGVQFGLYTATGTTPIATSITNANGIATFTNVIPGQYVVKEIAALEGYILSNVALPVTVTDDEETYHVGTMVNRLIRGDVFVDKVDGFDEPLAGAEFGLFDTNGKLVTTAVSDSAGIANLTGIPYGSYILKELTAPTSYEKSDEEVAIEILIDGSVQTYTFVNKKVNVLGDNFGEPNINSNESGKGGKNPESKGGNPQVKSNQLPKTGDSISTMMWLFIGSGLLIVAYMVVARRRAQKQ